MGITTVFSELPSNGEQSEIMARLLITEIKEGALNPLELKAFLKHFENAMEKVWENVEPELMAEAEKWKGQTLNGFKVDIREGRPRYDFSNCNDPKYDTYKLTEEEFKDLRSGREKFLKSLTAPIQLIDEETGDVIQVNPPVKTSSTTIFLSK